MPRPLRLARVAGALCAVALVTAFYVHWVRVVPTTAALTYVVVILVIATGWGIAESTIAAFAAMLCFNFFFLPPTGTFTVADPQNWVALVAFLVSAIIASQLSGRGRLRQIESAGRQQDLERLYAFSRSLLLWEAPAPIQATIAQRVAEIFGLAAVAVYDRRTDTIRLGGPGELPGIDETLRDVARQAVPVRGPAGLLVTPITLGGAPIGSLALPDIGISDTVLQSIANLVAIGLERARSQETAARGEAARQSGALRAAIMDALAHDFKTPLTAATVAATELGARAGLSPRDRELVDILGEELGRMRALVTDAVRVLRIDAGDFVVRHDRHQLAPLVAAALNHTGPRLDNHPIANRVPPDIVVEADRDLVELALGQLLDNAAKYSPPGSPIAIDATDRGAVVITVSNTGPPIPEAERTRIFERFYRSDTARRVPGSGLGLAIVRQIAEAHGGTVTVSSAPGMETAFTLSLPHRAAP